MSAVSLGPPAASTASHIRGVSWESVYTPGVITAPSTYTTTEGVFFVSSVFVVSEL